MSATTSAALSLHKEMSDDEVEQIRVMLGRDVRATAITGKDADLARMMHEIGVNRGFYDEMADSTTSRTAMSLLHIMGEIDEFHQTADDLRGSDLEAAREMADITILLLDMVGFLARSVFISDLKWNLTRQQEVDSDVVAITCAIGRLANRFYKTGEIDEILLMAALNESIRIGQTYSDGGFRKVILAKSKRNTERAYRFGTRNAKA